MGLALGGGERLAHGLQLRGGLRGLEGEGLGGVDGAEDGGGVDGVAGELIGARQSVAEVDLLRLRRAGERSEDLKRALRIVLLQVGGGQLDGCGGGEDAVGIAVGEAVEESVGIAGVAGLDGSLRGEIIGVVCHRFTGVLGLGEVGDCFGVAMVLHIGVAKREIGRGGGFAGMGTRVGEDSGVGVRRARGGQLLCHGTQLRGGEECLGELDAARCRGLIGCAAAGVGLGGFCLRSGGVRRRFAGRYRGLFAGAGGCC